MDQRLSSAALLACLVASLASAAAAQVSTNIISSGNRFALADHLRREGTTLFVFLNRTSAMEQTFLEDLLKQLPPSEKLAVRVIRLRDLDQPAAKQHEITATPTVLVVDRFSRTVARTSDPAAIRAAVGKGLRSARIGWVDEEDPKAPEVYGAPAAALRRGVPGIVKAMSVRPDAMQLMGLLSRMHFSEGFLTRREHELIAAYVSALNKCKF